MTNEIAEYISNEWFVVRHSGELPEVALHASLHFLTEADDGPKIFLAEAQLLELQEAALERYREIVLRDLTPENRDTTMYRGVKRSIVNYRRYRQFCQRQGLEATTRFSEEVAAALLFFLVAEAADAGKHTRQPTLNCSFHELNDFAVELGLEPEKFPAELANLCRVHD